MMPSNLGSLTAEQDRLLEASRALLETAQGDGRDLSASERAEIQANTAAFDELEAERRAIEAVDQMTASAGRRTEAPPISGRTPGQDFQDERGFALPTQGKTFARMFGQHAATDLAGWHNGAEFYKTIALGHSDRRLMASADSEAGSPGGFLVPGILAAAIFDASLAMELVRPRAKTYNLVSSNISVAGLDTQDQSTRGSVGGLAMEMLPELGQATDQTPKFRMLNFIARKGMIYCRASIELVEDAANFVEEMTNGFASAMAQGLDNQAYRGTGAGQALGILNAPATISVAKETNQVADTIVLENVLKMYSRLYPPSIKTSTWWAHPSTIPELFQLQVKFKDAAGTDFVGGSLAPIFTQLADGSFNLLGRPLEVTHHCNPLGDQGDIALLNWGAYGFALRRLVTIESNRATGWQSYAEDFRGVVRFDGQPLRSKPIVLPDGADSLSDFVTLDAR